MRLIDKDAILHDLENGVYPASMTYTLAVDIAKGLIEVASEIDAVPVVRCKDCKHYNTAGCSVGFGWCESMDRGTSDEFFCSCGAKMEGESE